MATKYVMGLFKNEDQAAEAIHALKKSDWPLHRTHSPIPSHKIAAVLNLKSSKVGWFTLAGGILGFLTGYSLAIFTAVRWGLIVSGKPVIAYIPFVIVGFEFTILFAIFGNLIGMMVLSGLPRQKNLENYDPRCSGEHFGILSSCEDDEREGLSTLFTRFGGEVQVFD
jgi:hypothetical protein